MTLAEMIMSMPLARLIFCIARDAKTQSEFRAAGHSLGLGSLLARVRSLGRLNQIQIMKHKLLSASLLCLALGSASVHADLLYWSANGTVVSGSPGTWNTTLARWGTSTSGPFTTVWNNANSDSATLSASGASFGSILLGANITMNGTLSMEQ